VKRGKWLTLTAIAVTLGGCDMQIPVAQVATEIPAPQAPAGPACNLTAPDVFGVARTDLNNLPQAIKDADTAIRERLVADAAGLAAGDKRAAETVINLVLNLMHTLRTRISPQPVTDQLPAGQQEVSVKDIGSFAQAMHQRALPTATPPATATPAAATTAPSQTDLDKLLFDRILIQYVAAYVEGSYVDRFGNKLAAPTFSRTVGDTEIAGVLSVVLDAVGDYLLRTPIWVDQTPNPTKYYPAAFAQGGTPTTAQAGAVTTPHAGATVAAKTAAKPATGTKAAATSTTTKGKGTAGGTTGGTQSTGAALVPTASLVMDPGKPKGTPLFQQIPLVAAGACGIDAMKAEAIEYAGQIAALKASAISGMLTGSLGGGGFSFVVFQKFSVGDNETLRVLVQTLLAKVFERVAAESAYRILLNTQYIPNTYPDLMSLVQALLSNQLKSATPQM